MKIPTFTLCSAIILLVGSEVMSQTSSDVESYRALHQQNRDDAIAKATKTLDESYLEKLERIKARLTTAGRLEEALEIDALLKELDLEKKLPGEWQWGEDPERILKLSSDHNAQLSSDTNKAAWIALGPRQIRLFFVHTSYVVNFDPEMETGTAERKDGVKAVIKRIN